MQRNFTPYRYEVPNPFEGVIAWAQKNYTLEFHTDPDTIAVGRCQDLTVKISGPYDLRGQSATRSKIWPQ